MNIETICTHVQRIARSTGAYLKSEQASLREKDVELKGARNYVTYIDKEAEQQLVKALSALLPNAGFLTEEATVNQTEKEYMWIIDPLDGTTNYVHGDTPYSVSIALMKSRKIILGVVYDPVLNEMFFAAENGKAYLNDMPLCVSKKQSIENAYLGFGIPYSLDDKGEHILKNAFTQFRTCSFRIKGSAALETCYVAGGRSDAYFHSGLSPWDVAAATFILECAGGECSDFSGGDNYIFGRELVASNGAIHGEIMQKIIKNTRI